MKIINTVPHDSHANTNTSDSSYFHSAKEKGDC